MVLHSQSDMNEEYFESTRIWENYTFIFPNLTSTDLPYPNLHFPKESACYIPYNIKY